VSIILAKRRWRGRSCARRAAWCGRGRALAAAPAADDDRGRRAARRGSSGRGGNAGWRTISRTRTDRWPSAKGRQKPQLRRGVRGPVGAGARLRSTLSRMVPMRSSIMCAMRSRRARNSVFVIWASSIVLAARRRPSFAVGTLAFFKRGGRRARRRGPVRLHAAFADRVAPLGAPSGGFAAPGRAF
jgi:hypothetical protein